MSLNTDCSIQGDHLIQSQLYLVSLIEPGGWCSRIRITWGHNFYFGRRSRCRCLHLWCSSSHFHCCHDNNFKKSSRVHALHQKKKQKQDYLWNLEILPLKFKPSDSNLASSNSLLTWTNSMFSWPQIYFQLIMWT